VGLANLGSESETCVASRVHLVGVSISFEENFYRFPFTPPPLWFAVPVLHLVFRDRKLFDGLILHLLLLLVLFRPDLPRARCQN
jgi:hypothetical protein